MYITVLYSTHYSIFQCQTRLIWGVLGMYLICTILMGQ